jgi:hypothetical protein
MLYAAMVIFVAMRWEGYSWTSQTVSDLSAIGALTRPLWVTLGVVYTLLVVALREGIRGVGPAGARRRRLEGRSFSDSVALDPRGS